MIQSDQVLITGGSGFIASHCMAGLLKKGYRVKASLRSLHRIPEVKEFLSVAGVTNFEPLSFVQADLSDAAAWKTAAEGCRYVIHTASPTPNFIAKHEDEYIVPAVNGVMHVLRAAKAAGVERVVLTSAFGAICYGTDRKRPYTEEDWTDLSKDIPAYQRSKTMAEKAAWEYVNGEGKGLELAVVNPVGVLGPVLGADYSHSIQFISQMLNGQLKGVPRIKSVYVDVRDVADLHIKAMTHPEARGQRFLATSGESVSLLDIATILRSALGNKAAKVPKKEVPNWILRLVGLFNPKVKMILPHLGMVKDASHEKATRLLNWHPTTNKEAIVATAESLIRLGLVK
ncbi:aldehyde reductase [Flavitalea sp. BT771]|uniref:SDR family oxidoreductase n=1 Tax=Flavitalea sp. BT771 TaxID=3063329 RepID=UPI0026E3F4BE|nr:aldehyde reductase [Flavitalea sp. BT771]MDO6432692.1 aldehyde reductase [Flavitalea sp. BT771]MDV6222032.1 aldehyde reductase [Flavitalea sp. BT771]